MKSLFLTILIGSITLFSAQVHSAPNQSDLGFQTAFHRPFYKKKTFGLFVTGTSVLAAGAFSYLTAGAGAPAAAAGVSSVASWLAGGGAGSYMAGLSIVGGWFGGNAMLGAAVLNGISLGTVGAAGTWASLTAGQKALALATTTATALDGILIVSKPDSKELEWRMRLNVPRYLADEETRDLLAALDEATIELTEVGSALASATRSQTPNAPKSSEHLLLERNFAAAEARHAMAVKQIEAELDYINHSGGTNHMMVVMAVIAQNQGRSASFRSLINRVNADSLEDRSYYNYLLAIGELQLGDLTKAKQLLQASWKEAPYAIEPAILLAGIAGVKDFQANEPKIDEIVNLAKKNFDADKYDTPVGLTTLHYRVGTMALNAERCDASLKAFNNAQDEQSTVSKYFHGKDIRNFLDIGKANALHCLGKISDAHKLFKAVQKRNSSDDGRVLCEQYRAGCVD